MDPERLQELVQSIQVGGLREPLMVRPQGDVFEVVSGHRRLQALQQLGWSEAPVRIREMSDEEADFYLLDMNLNQENLSEVEEAAGIHRMINAHGWSQSKTAERFAKSQRWVSYRLNLVQRLVPQVQDQVSTRVLSASTATRIAQAPPDLQPAIAAKVQSVDLSTRETEQLVKVVTDPKVPEDVKRALAENPKITPEHAQAIAKARDPKERAKLLRSAEARSMSLRELSETALLSNGPADLELARSEKQSKILSLLIALNDLTEEIDSETFKEIEDERQRERLDRLLIQIAPKLTQLRVWVKTALKDKPKSAYVVEFKRPGQ